MLVKSTTKLIRRFLIGPQQRFAFTHTDKVELPKIDKIGMYIHIPFCRDMCPYCPYNRIKYNKKLVKPYTEALLREIERYYEKLGKIKIPSVYIGGGTPTNLIDELGIILRSIREKFNVSGDIYIETTPSDIDKTVVKKLEEYDIKMISLGVQSFHNRLLKIIGRKYTSRKACRAIDLILSGDFKSLNLDLMFALPEETQEELKRDLKQAVKSGANQVTTYPLFTFPYSSVGRYRKLKKIVMPNFHRRRKMYRFIHEFCIQNGFERVSVWGFKKGKAPRFSSVTRDFYIGFGAGAGTYVPGTFYLNTFSVKEYIKSLKKNKSPVTLEMNISESFFRYHWLYWRLYDTYIPRKELVNLFGSKNLKLKLLLSMGRLFNLTEEHKNFISLTERGSFWIHLIQNYFFLDYVNRVWSAAMEEPWPEEIKI